MKYLLIFVLLIFIGCKSIPEKDLWIVGKWQIIDSESDRPEKTKRRAERCPTRRIGQDQRLARRVWLAVDATPSGARGAGGSLPAAAVRTYGYTTQGRP